MPKIEWKPGNMLYPLPVVMVSVADEEGHDNIITVAWAGTVCTNPPMVSISVRPERYSYKMLMETREFVINLTTEKLAYATDYCGVKSGRDVDKFKAVHLTRQPASHVGAPMIKESPVSIECRVREVQEYGSHSVFTADVLAVHVDDKYMDEKGKFDLALANPIVYSHGEYYGLGKKLGTFGVILAKVLGYEFLDSDLLIQKEENALLREIIEKKGLDGFLEIENRVNASIETTKAVIATGGSVVYCQEAMEHLKEIGTVIYLKLDYSILQRRLGNLKGRGVVLREGQTLKGLYNERTPLYEKYADIVIDEKKLNVEQTLQKILEELEK